MEDRLYRMFANVNDWLKFAEAKNFGLLTFNAVVIFGITQIDFVKYCSLKLVCYYIISPLSMLSILCVLISLMPILTSIEKGSHVKSWINLFANLIDKEVVFENIHFFGYLKTIDPNEFQRKLSDKLNITPNFSDFEIELIGQILYNSRITALKYQLFKMGGFLTLLAIILSIIISPILLNAIDCT
jgi:hypothetical protein